MSVPAGIEDVKALEDDELSRLLTLLERDERLVSKRRTTLHRRIEFVRAGGFASTDPEQEQLSALEATEAELSNQRHALHLRIDELVGERSRRSLQA